MRFKKFIFSSSIICFFSCVLILTFIPVSTTAQNIGFIKGKIFDRKFQIPLAGVQVLKSDTSHFILTSSDGSFQMPLKEGTHNLLVRMIGYQSLMITSVPVKANNTTSLNINIEENVNLSAKQDKSNMDSLPATDTIRKIKFSASIQDDQIMHWRNNAIRGKLITEKAISAGSDKDLSSIIARLPGVTLWQSEPFDAQQFLIINGMGSRYNQVLLNGQVSNSFDPLSKQYPFNSFPTESIESVQLQEQADASLPADYSGGSLNIVTKVIPLRNFFSVQGGIEVLSKSINKEFYGDKIHGSEWLSLPVSERKLPDGFPSTRSQYQLSEKDPQEKTDLLSTLDNNLSPSMSTSIPATRLMVGMGRNFTLKNGARWGFTTYLKHQQQEIFDASAVQAVPNLATNPYPFSQNQPLISAYANDMNYRFQSQLALMFNTGIEFGKNKIALRTLFGNHYNNTYTSRDIIYKPDEDSMAGIGHRYHPEQRKFLNLQLNGEHALGQLGKFRMEWQFAFSQYQQLDPDERNFLVRQNPSNKSLYELATPNVSPVPDRNNVSNAALDQNLAAIFTNSFRSWRTQKDSYFSGWANLSFPFTMLSLPQEFKGGIYMQTSFRELYTDLLLYQGKGYVPLDSLIAQDRYYPGGVAVEEYYSKVISSSGFFSSADINADNLGNHTGSVNTGSSFIQYTGNLSRWLKVKSGLRFESASMLISSSEYYYYEGYKNAQIISLDENATVARFDLLPSIGIMISPLKSVYFQLSWYKTLNRPLLQELSSYRFYDAKTFMVKSGNPFLETSLINNYFATLNWNHSSGLNIEISGYYKSIYQAIEPIITRYPGANANYLSTPHNVPPAKVYGMKTSFQLPLIKDYSRWFTYLSLFASGQWTWSEVEAGPVRSIASPSVAKHSLAGTPELSVNGGIILQYPKWPQFSLIYQGTSDYLQAVGSGLKIGMNSDNDIYAIPDYRVKGMQQLNVQLSYSIFHSSLQIIGGIENLLNSPYIVYQDLNGNEAFDEPLKISQSTPTRGYYLSGTDNTIININNQQSYYLRFAYTFN